MSYVYTELALSKGLLGCVANKYFQGRFEIAIRRIAFARLDTSLWPLVIGWRRPSSEWTKRLLIEKLRDHALNASPCYEGSPLLRLLQISLDKIQCTLPINDQRLAEQAADYSEAVCAAAAFARSVHHDLCLRSLHVRCYLEERESGATKDQSDVAQADQDGGKQICLHCSSLSSSSEDLLSHGLALHAAAYMGDIAMLDRLLEDGAPLNGHSPYFDPPLYVAVRANNSLSVSALLERGATIDADALDQGSVSASRAGTSALWDAVWHGFEDVVRLIIDNRNLGRDELVDYHYLGIAVENGHERVTRLLLQRGVHPDDAPPDQMTAISIAAQHQVATSCMQELLSNGADVNSGPQGFTPLHHCASVGNLAGATMLLQFGADPNIRTRKSDSADTLFVSNLTPLTIAAARGFHPLVCLLLSHGADPNVVDGSGSTAVMDAMEFRKDDIAKTLIEHGAIVSDIPRALGIAVRQHDTVLLELLLAHIPQTSEPNETLKRAIGQAMQRDNIRAIQKFVTHIAGGAEIALSEVVSLIHEADAAGTTAVQSLARGVDSSQHAATDAEPSGTDAASSSSEYTTEEVQEIERDREEHENGGPSDLSRSRKSNLTEKPSYDPRSSVHGVESMPTCEQDPDLNDGAWVINNENANVVVTADDSYRSEDQGEDEGADDDEDDEKDEGADEEEEEEDDDDYDYDDGNDEVGVYDRAVAYESAAVSVLISGAKLLRQA